MTMKRNDLYVDLDAKPIALSDLDADERRLIARLRRRAAANPSWDAFDNYWTRTVAAFYESRGLRPKAVTRTAAWRIAQDLSSRLGIAQGYIEPDDYRDELQGLIREHYPS